MNELKEFDLQICLQTLTQNEPLVRDLARLIVEEEVKNESNSIDQENLEYRIQERYDQIRLFLYCQKEKKEIDLEFKGLKGVIEWLFSQKYGDDLQDNMLIDEGKNLFYENVLDLINQFCQDQVPLKLLQSSSDRENLINLVQQAEKNKEQLHQEYEPIKKELVAVEAALSEEQKQLSSLCSQFDEERKKNEEEIKKMSATLEEYQQKNYQDIQKQLTQAESEITEQKKRHKALASQLDGKKAMANLRKPFAVVGYIVFLVIICFIFGGGNPVAGFAIFMIISAIYSVLKSWGL
ncbi:hypothetical protein CWATWH0402_2980 [Crocosphaera watsonii WH 0402]|uniref:Uncharacterized protein n=1 Tax=Crocosphaera watsonii WH 0402 TaxID=1284629 RepID=T2JYD8_CROWT|nr:OmpH family outer membrane protein [Crocosphaera watsonii]CCQ70099.1 hypothetical protein CWATWH0402_2980 [Crocosphaera watsonii WH 0402]